MRHISAALLPLIFSLIASHAAAQETLPQGIGLYQFGQRTYGVQVESWNADGEKVALGSRFDRTFDGETMLSGKAGAELKRLADELAKYEGDNPQAAGLLSRLNLGAMSGDVNANVNARFVGIGFGINDSLTFFFGVPWIWASVQSELYVTGENNALAIKQELGDLAYDELKQGLDRAALLNEQQIRQNILDAGFAPFESWEHSGYGDVRLGFKTAFTSRLGSGLRLLTVISPTLEIPTGYTEHPDLLTDVNFGKGYYALGLSVEERLVIARTFWLGIDGSVAENFGTTVEKRLPEANENLPAADRKMRVTLAPGDDVDTAGSLGVTFGWVSASWRTGLKRHFRDTYSGSAEGNYAALAAGSDSYQQYQQARLTFSTAEAYRRKKFPLPFLLSLGASQPVTARNSADESYYELSVASFFSTPLARSDKQADGKKRKARKKRSSFLTQTDR
jgi:hypothetical protein